MFSTDGPNPTFHRPATRIQLGSKVTHLMAIAVGHVSLATAIVGGSRLKPAIQSCALQSTESEIQNTAEEVL